MFGFVVYSDYLPIMNNHNNTVRPGNKLQNQQIRFGGIKPAKGFAAAQALSKHSPKYCEKCNFHDAFYSDETLGRICYKCKEWFGDPKN